MNAFQKLLIFFVVIVAEPAFSQKKISLKSPDGNILFSFKLTQNAPVYSVGYKGKTLIENSKLSLSFKEGGVFGANLKISVPIFRKADEIYELVVGKAKSVRDQHNEVSIGLEERTGAKRQINLVIRAFNDGLAFRYEFPKQKNWTSYTLTDENSTFKMVGNPKVRTLFRENFNTSHEGFYDKILLSKIKTDTLMDIPTLFEFPQNIYMAITEANLRDYAGMYLTKKNGILKSQLSPLQGQMEVKVKAILPHHTPWRVMLIGDRVGSLIESNIITSLSEPSKIKDLSWLKPGKTSFHWWNGDVTPDTSFAPGINFETNKYYIDFCARNKIEYHSVIGYGGFAWYKSDAAGYGEIGPNTDVTKTVLSLDMKQVCDYAKEKGVGIHVWVNWKALYPKLEEAFSQFEKWGIKGLMVDFMDRDDQEMVNIQEEILKRAAEHKLFIQFHGVFKPTGLHRTYPNEFTREGAHNYEHNKMSNKAVSADHDLDIIFTRMLAGPTDYHLGGFRAVQDANFKPQYTRPLMTGTRCHMLAMYVVLESYLGMVADYPEAYEGQPGFDLLKEIPTTWDETIVPAAEVGEYVTVARRKGTDWYVGSINNNKARIVKVSLDFLSTGNYSAKIYRDDLNSDNPNHLKMEFQTINKSDIITIKLAAGGGSVIRIFKK
ncbi:MAG: glycoside hydrolase family 97 protein [Flavobacterium sp.]|nr:glycoside hydrolase family 97 protein [Pedobacter sp.]